MSTTTVSLLISGATVITVDSRRRVVEDGAIAVQGDRIIDVGPRGELQRRYTAEQVIDASRKVALPGLIDSHGHAGHGLVKTLGGGDSDVWYNACHEIYSRGSDEEFWYAEALLTNLERLKFGVTTGVSFMGGGNFVMRTDDPAYGERHCQAVQELGIRAFVVVGPSTGPFPNTFARWRGNQRTAYDVSFEDQVQTCETLIGRWHGKAEGRIRLATMLPVHNTSRTPLDSKGLANLKAQARTIRDLTQKHGVVFSQDGHTTGTVKFAHEALGLLGPQALLSHSTGLTKEEIRICAETDTRIVHNPSSAASYVARCPVTELLDAGVTVCLGSDGTAPDRSYDMFRHMFQAMRYHRRYFADQKVLPPGKILEMVTIDAARALGLEKELGSLEPGKKADIILLDTFRPHLYPSIMPLYQVVNFANGNDVDTTIVDGQVLMERRKVTTVDEGAVLERAQVATETMLDRTGFRQLLKTPEGAWGKSRLP
jgi:5-methylthioadenosine/S-adenosylhomocysteine deaminase